MSDSSIALLLPADDPAIATTVRTLQAVAVGVRVVSGSDPTTVLRSCGPGIKFVMVHQSMLIDTLDLLPNRTMNLPIVVFTPETEEQTLLLGLRIPSVVALIAWSTAGARTWEVLYTARRLLAPREEAPTMANLLPWGSTTVAWQPRNTSDLRKIVERIEGLCDRLGIERRAAAAVSSASHELLMNAVYDAPVGRDGRPKYAHDRTADVQLEPQEVPSFRCTVSGDLIGLDSIDPFGRLPRNRYFEGVLRGHRMATGASGPTLDTSHGGAGLGLHTLYASGAVLRAELTPMQRTHVSWIFDRSIPHRERRRAARSLYFIPNLTRSPSS
jgi:hypothetical protein